MNAFVVGTLALCVAAGQLAAANYGSQPGAGYQRKMAPSPQTYQAATSGYGQQQQHQQQVGYGAEQAPSYGKSNGYGNQAAASGYAKPAPKYEEPYYPPMPFAWGYDINDGYGGAQYHKENGDEYGKRTGSYGYTDAYGVYRQVDYVADEHGFRATIKTNEPGTANESPADVELHAYEPPSNYYAGNTYNQAGTSSYGSNGGSASYSSGSSGSSSGPSSYGSMGGGYSTAPAAVYQQQAAPRAAAYSPAPRAYQQRSGAGYSSAAQYSAGSAPMYQQQQQQQQQKLLGRAY